MIYYTSDWHFGHKNIIKYCSRPFEVTDDGVKQCDSFIIKKYCSVVKNDDFVIFLGDAFFGSRKTKLLYQQMIRDLPGKKIMLRGNHDYESEEFYLNCGFMAVLDYIKADPYFICHYAFSDIMHNDFKFEISEHEKSLFEIFKNCGCRFLIHGHTHNISPCDSGCTRINVCIDCRENDFKPVRVEESEPYIQAFLKDKGFML